MSHHSHINGHSAHVHVPNVKLGPTHFEGTRYDWKSWHNEEETQNIGLGIGKLLKWFFKWTFWSVAFGGSTVFDTLRMVVPNTEFFDWKRVAALWFSLLGFLCLATGVPGCLLMVLLGLLLVFKPCGNFGLFMVLLVLLGLYLTLKSFGYSAFPIPLLNGLLSIPIPNIGPRVELMKVILGQTGRGQELLALTHTSLGGVPLIDWWTRLDYASLLIPAFLTLSATVKYFRMSRAGEFVGDGDPCEARPWSAVQILWFVFAVSLVVFGLPGAPFGLWTLISLLGWLWFGETRHASVSGFDGGEVSTGASFDRIEPEAAPAPPPAPRPAPGGLPADLASSLRDFEEEEHRRKAQPRRRSDYDE